MPSDYPEFHRPQRMDLVHHLPEPPAPEPLPAARRQKPAKQPRQAVKANRTQTAHGHGVRTIHLRPRTLMIGGISLLLLSTLYFGATAYLFFRDDLMNAAAARQNAILATQTVRDAREIEATEIYEGKIAALHDKIGKLTTEIDQLGEVRSQEKSTTDQKVRDLLARQKELEARQTALSKLTEAARRAGLDVPAPGTIKPKPVKGRKAALDPEVTGSISPTVAKPAARFADMGIRPGAKGQATEPMPPPVDPRLEPLARKIAAMQADQDAVVLAMAGKMSSRTSKIETVLKRLGRRVPPGGRNVDVGGPFVPASASQINFKAEVTSLAGEFDRYARLRSIALALPLKRPLEGADISSGFGTRVDPFLGRPATHTGIDFRAPSGTPARTVVAGTVIAAGYNGGYGNCVDVDHGNGVVTRYGHLSKIEARVGERVVAGQKIGRVGSTGRSTGPHLHYEIRIDGEAINPMIYLKAGQEITAWL